MSERDQVVGDLVDGEGGGGGGNAVVDPPEVDPLFEKAEQEVMSYLPEMAVSELEALCRELGLEIPPEKKLRRDIYRLVVGHLMEKEQEDADKGKARYIQMHGVLRNMLTSRHDQDPLQQIPVQSHDMKPPPQFAYTVVPDVTAKPVLPHMNDVNVLNYGKHASSASTPLFSGHKHDTAKPVPKAPPALYHLKECKIRGTIGDPGEKDKLGYYGLISEIKERSREGYDDNRVVGAVINAITPGNVFKKRLEMRRNLEGSISPLPYTPRYTVRIR